MAGFFIDQGFIPMSEVLYPQKNRVYTSIRGVIHSVTAGAKKLSTKPLQLPRNFL